MKAIVMHSLGGPEVLQPSEMPRPAPGVGEILIRVRAAGVNPVDCKIRSGKSPRFAPALPAIPGRDVSGLVAGTGPEATRFRAGDEVYAFLASHSGGYASYAIAREDEVALKPTSLDHVHAAAVPLAAVTAWQALFDHGRLQPGQRVLVHGAAGGVGHFAVQFAKVHGAVVFATAAAGDRELLRELGADLVIDHEQQAFEREVRDIDLVIDLIGGETQRRSWQVLKDGGTLVSTLERPSPDEAAKKHARAGNFMARPSTAVLTEIARLIDSNKVRVVLQETYPLDEAARAQDELEHKHSAGKRVLAVP